MAGHTVRAGGYVAYVVDPKRVDLLPWVNVKGKVLGGAYGLNLAGRVPLDGSSLTAFSDDSSILWGSGPLKAGISGTFKVTEGQTLTGGIGPKLSYSITPRLTVSSRYVIKNRGENVLRFAFATTF